MRNAVKPHEVSNEKLDALKVAEQEIAELIDSGESEDERILEQFTNISRPQKVL
jgi:hypothetical protein